MYRDVVGDETLLTHPNVSQPSIMTPLAEAMQQLDLVLFPVDITITRICNILQYFTAVKTGNFQLKYFIFILIFALNIDRGYTL